MLKGDAVHMVRRALEETGATFTEEQIEALAVIVLKIAGRIVEEAMASLRLSGPGSRSHYLGD